MKTNDERLADILEGLDHTSHIRLERIPDIDLYMDQVLSFMEENLKQTRRMPEDKVLTKTMINNYAKNALIPPPVKKKYSREHMILLIFIYYYKNLLSINDIGQLFEPITAHYFKAENGRNLCDIYNEVFSLEDEQMKRLREDIRTMFDFSRTTFTDAPEEEQEYLQLFTFISELAFDVYRKKQIIERMIDQLRSETQAGTANGKKSRMEK